MVEEDFRLWASDEGTSPASVAATAWREASNPAGAAGSSGIAVASQGTPSGPIADEVRGRDEAFALPNRAHKDLDEAAPVPGVDPASSGWERVLGGSWKRRAAPSPRCRDSTQPCQEVEDLVNMGTAASMRNVGCTLWLSWAGARLPPGSRTKPRHSSTLIGMSKDGAAVFGELYSQGNIPRQHNDLALLHHL